MAVRREHFDAAQVAFPRPVAARFSDLFRRLDGTWHFTVDLDVEVELPDGRRVRTRKLVAVPATDYQRRTGRAS